MILRSATAVAVLLLVAQGAMAAPSGEESDAVAAGDDVYRHNCARCHGFRMTNPASGVFDLRTFPRDDPARFTGSVRDGKGAMPAWGATLSAAEIESVWRYVSAEPATQP